MLKFPVTVKYEQTLACLNVIHVINKMILEKNDGQIAEKVAYEKVYETNLVTDILNSFIDCILKTKIFKERLF